ncbi:MAG: helix-turn-helix domain-containing protein [Labilithrix sp.]|nr:helix-turn-helix domain-containing protein [Labilithrix sp.]
MSAVVVISPEDLEKLIERAVRKALDEAGATRTSEEWVSIKATGLPPTTVRKLIKQGAIRAAKIGRELRVNAHDLRSHVQSSIVEPKDEASNVVELPSDPFEAARVRARARRAG